MFDGSLMVEAVRAHILLKLAEAKLGRRALGLTGTVFIVIGQWLRARAASLSPTAQPVKSWER